MAEQIQRKQEIRERVDEMAEVDAEIQAAGHVATEGAGVKIKEELDGLLDEIDEVLETNAEDFVKAYVQKGGE